MLREKANTMQNGKPLSAGSSDDTYVNEEKEDGVWHGSSKHDSYMTVVYMASQ